MAQDNTIKDIFVQTNATDPTTAVIASRESSSAVGNIPFIDGDKNAFRFFLMEEDQTTGELRNRTLQSGESLSVVVRASADDESFGSWGTFAESGIQSNAADVFNVYFGTNRDGIGGEWLAFSLNTTPTDHVRVAQNNYVCWFRTDGGSLPPSLDGYQNVKVDVADGTTPAEALQAKLAGSTFSGVISDADVIKTEIGEYVQFDPAVTGTVPAPLVSDTTKLRIESAATARDAITGYKSTFDAAFGSIATEMGSADTFTAKMVIQLKQSTGSLTKTLAIQDCTFYRNFSA